MTSWLMVVPAIDPHPTAEFLRRCRLPHERILLVDNAEWPLSTRRVFRQAVRGQWDGRYHREGRNLGVAGSWNVGARAVLAEGLDWLVIASTSYRFGPAGGLDFIAGLDDCTAIGLQTSHGWHLIAVHRRAFETVGLFDDGFWPAYWEECDFLHRLALAGLEHPGENGRPWGYVETDGEFGVQAATLTAGLAPIDLLAMEARYAAKWGGPVGGETFATPWGA